MASKLISKLSIGLTLSTRGLQQGFKQVQRQTRQFGQKVKASSAGLSDFGKRFRGMFTRMTPAISGVAGRLGGLVGTFGKLAAAAGPAGLAIGGVVASLGALALGGAAVYRAAVAGQREIQEMRDFAQVIGSTAQQLNRLEVAGELANVPINVMRLAMQRSSRRISEAAAGSGEAVKALQAMGLEAKELVRMPLDQRMVAIARAFRDNVPATDQLRLAFKLFDAEGVKVLRALRLLEDGLGGVQAQMDELNLNVSGDAAERIDKVNTSWKRVQLAIKGIKRTLAQELLPVFEQIFQHSDQIAKTIGSWTKIALGAFQNLTGYFGKGEDLARGMREHAAQQKREVADMHKAQGEASRKLRESMTTQDRQWQRQLQHARRVLEFRKQMATKEREILKSHREQVAAFNEQAKSRLAAAGQLAGATGAPTIGARSVDTQANMMAEAANRQQALAVAALRHRRESLKIDKERNKLIKELIQQGRREMHQEAVRITQNRIPS